MATKGYVQSILNRLASPMKQATIQAFDYVLDNLRIGPVESTSGRRKAENWRLYRFDVTTSSTANTEVSFAHGFNESPLLAIPFLPLGSSGAYLPRLRISRAADVRRVYVSSPDTNVTVSLLVEV